MAKKKEGIEWTEGMVSMLLYKRYSDLSVGPVYNRKPKGWVYIPGVRNKVGMSGSREADGLAVSIWSSTGYSIEGFEIKVSRSDWLHELKHPEKSDAIMKYCDRWWVVAPAGVVKKEDLPKGWGQLEARKDKLITKHRGGQLTPIPLDKLFVIEVIKKAMSRPEADKDSWQKELDAAYAKGKKERGSEDSWALKHLREQIKEDDEKEKTSYEVLKKVQADLGVEDWSDEARNKKLIALAKVIGAFDNPHAMSIVERQIAKMSEGLELLKSAKSEIIDGV